jgi:hypothetical protein
MKRAPATVRRFFPNDIFEQGRMEELGYLPVNVSIFDHYLTEEEDRECKIMFYSQAIKAGTLDEYMVGERQFLALYSDLANEGAYVEWKDSYWLAEADDVAFVRLQVESLREKIHMDVYFIGPQIYVLGGHDRTDLFLLRNEEYLPELQRKVREFGLHVLIPKNF